MADVHGTCDERFSAVRAALARNLDGDELGASVAVDLDGQTVVDLIVVDLDRRLTISYLMNRMAPGILGSDRSESYVRAVYEAVG